MDLEDKNKLATKETNEYRQNMITYKSDFVRLNSERNELLNFLEANIKEKEKYLKENSELTKMIKKYEVLLDAH